MSAIMLPDNPHDAALETRILDTAVKLWRTKSSIAKRLLRVELHALTRSRTPERVEELELARLRQLGAI